MHFLAPQALRTAVAVGTKDSTATKVLETYIFLVNSVVLRKGKVVSRYDDALELWEQAIAAYPKYAAPYGWKGTVLYKMGRVQEAAELLEMAVQSGVGVAEIYYHLGLCYLAGVGDGGGGGSDEGTGRSGGMRGAAGMMFRKALQLDPAHSGAKLELGKLE